MLIPPYKIKTIEAIRLIPKGERIRKIKGFGFNHFNLQADDIYIDLLTDSGTNAMSQEQWAGIMRADETYAGARSFSRMEKTIQDITGFKYVLPTHQGRGAENVFDRVMVKPGQIVPGNSHFDTTKAHIEDKGGKAKDCTISEGFDNNREHPFKGNVDLEKLEQTIKENKNEPLPARGGVSRPVNGTGQVPSAAFISAPRGGAFQPPKSNIAYVLLTVTCNSNGGQPVSLENIKNVSELAKKYGLLLFFDGARFAENAYFIKEREVEYKEKSIREIIREMMSYADGMLMSAKKDALVNIGGFIALKDETLYEKLVPISILMEGFPTYGGMSGRAMEAIAQGLWEGIEQDYLAYYIGQVRYLGERLDGYGIPIIKPTGGHAVYIDAKKFLPHIPQEQFPGQALVCEIYIEAGIRTTEIGAVLAGRDPVTKENIEPRLEMVRLAIPRRVYGKEHLDYTIEAVSAVWKRRKDIKGLKFLHESPILRHFRSTFEQV